MADEDSNLLHRRRRGKNVLFTAMIAIPAFIVLGLLAAIVIEVLMKGAGAFSKSFFLETQKPFGDPGGGIANGIVGTLMVLGIASLISMPLSLTAALYLSERKGRSLARLLRLVIDSLQGIPSIVIGVVMYAWIVIPMKSFSAFAGGIALSLIMIPTVTTTMLEVLLLVPASYMEAAISLGAPHWRASLGIILPAAKTGILNGVGLGIARIAGETAPLLFTAFGNPFMNLNAAKPTSAIPLIIYDYIKSPYQDWHQKAWGAAFLLVLFVFLVNLLIGAGGKGKKSVGR
ncbi:MAG: phosphate ABC transporter permease PstA [Spirochaetales bacterium]|jgi:phosphate transport system permease protein